MYQTDKPRGGQADRLDRPAMPSVCLLDLDADIRKGPDKSDGFTALTKWLPLRLLRDPEWQ